MELRSLMLDAAVGVLIVAIIATPTSFGKSVHRRASDDAEGGLLKVAMDLLGSVQQAASDVVGAIPSEGNSHFTRRQTLRQIVKNLQDSAIKALSGTTDALKKTVGQASAGKGRIVDDEEDELEKQDKEDNE